MPMVEPCVYSGKNSNTATFIDENLGVAFVFYSGVFLIWSCSLAGMHNRAQSSLFYILDEYFMVNTLYINCDCRSYSHSERS